MIPMKPSNAEWLGDIPEAWNVARIGDFYKFRNEKVSDEDYAPLSVTMKGIVPQLATAAKSDDHNNRKLVKKGDFAINSRSDRRGSCGISPYDGSVSLINTILTPRGEMNPGYYNWLFHTEQFADEFYKWGHGIVDDLWTTRWQEMKSIMIVSPPVDEQQAIANYLDDRCAKIDTIIAKEKASIEEYKKLKLSIITNSVTGMMVETDSFKECNLGWIDKIPSGWSRYTLSNVVTSMRNGYVGPTRELFKDTGIKYIQSLHIKDGMIDFQRGEYFVSKEWADNHPKIHTDDILIVQTGDIGQVGLVTDEYDSCNCHALIIATPKQEIILPKYLMYYLRSFVGKEGLLLNKTGALLPHLNVGKIKYTSIICPNSIEEQEKIVKYLDRECKHMESLIDEKESLINELESYKKSLIYEVVTGKRKVVD